MGVCVIVLIYAHMKSSENNHNKTQMTPSQMTSESRIFLHMGLTPSALSIGSVRCTFATGSDFNIQDSAHTSL